MTRNKYAQYRRWLLLLGLFWPLGGMWWLSTAVLPSTADTPGPIVNYDLGYGFNVAIWDTAKLDEMGFNWIKVFDRPTSRLPQKLLLRIDVQHDQMADIPGWRQQIRELAHNHGAYIDAYEIGNEVNLDADYGWGASPVAADYVTLLCAAYEEIKAHDNGTSAIVVSAGLAPTGRVSGNWEGHSGHNGLYQDEREYLREMLTAEALDCLDVVGYHNYGYSADYDSPPDTNGGTPQTNCTNGFCFRGVEKIYDILVENGAAEVPIWTTEYGWITDPSEEELAHCLADPTWQGRAWQIVSQEKQAENLAGSFAYAAEHWPWMGAMFVFNLNFNEAWYYDECEQMRFYGVAGRPAETALRELPKAYEQRPPALRVDGPTAVYQFVLSDTQPFTQTLLYTLTNEGDTPISVTITSTLPTTTSWGAGWISPSTAVVSPTLPITVQVVLTNGVRPLGVYTGTVVFTAVANGQPVSGFPQEVPLWLAVVEQIYTHYLPLVTR